jgi:hypothetical protein
MPEFKKIKKLAANRRVEAGKIAIPQTFKV